MSVLKKWGFDPTLGPWLIDCKKGRRKSRIYAVTRDPFNVIAHVSLAISISFRPGIHSAGKVLRIPTRGAGEAGLRLAEASAFAKAEASERQRDEEATLGLTETGSSTLKAVESPSVGSKLGYK